MAISTLTLRIRAAILNGTSPLAGLFLLLGLARPPGANQRSSQRRRTGLVNRLEARSRLRWLGGSTGRFSNSSMPPGFPSPRWPTMRSSAAGCIWTSSVGYPPWIR